MKSSRLGLLGCILLAVWGCSAGQKAPDVKVAELSSGSKKRISDFKGKVVLIDAWATWCGPCRETMPVIQKFYNEFGSKGLEVMAISAETEPVVSRFLKESNYTYPFYLDTDNSFQEAYKINELPTSFVIDRAGNIVFSGHPGDEAVLREAIEAALR